MLGLFNKNPSLARGIAINVDGIGTQLKAQPDFAHYSILLLERSLTSFMLDMPSLEPAFYDEVFGVEFDLNLLATFARNLNI